MTEEQYNAFRERITGIIKYQNALMRKKFLTVDQYVGYKVRAVNMIQVISDMLFNPYVLKDFAEALSSDNLYFIGTQIPDTTSAFGQRVVDYNTRISELTLEAVNILSGGQIRWNKYTEDNITLYFLWVEPDGLEEAIEKMTRQIRDTDTISKDTPTETVSQLN